MLISGDSSKEAEKEAVELAAQISFKVSYHICVTDIVTIVSCFEVIRELKQTMMTAAMRMAPNKRLNEQNKDCAHVINIYCTLHNNMYHEE